MKARCNAMRTTERAGVAPGKWHTYRCRKIAAKEFTIHQPSDHPLIADGWFKVFVCEDCIKRGKDA